MSSKPEFDAIEEARLNWSQEWPEAALAMATATSIMRAQQIVLSAVDSVLRPLDLTFARYEALMLLSFSRNGSMPLGKMGQRLMIHPTSVTSIIDRLSKDQLVQRKDHPMDRRTTLAEITPAGRELARRATTAVNDVAFGVGELADSQMKQLIQIILDLRHSAGDFD
jgi:DNA-binding MarR family transcriptional regulator